LNRLKTIALAGLGVVNLAAAIFAWRGFVGEAREDVVPARSAPLILPAAQPADPAPAVGEDRETLARPLFDKSRRPVQGMPRSAGTTEAPSGIKLLAVIGFSHTARAFVVSGAAAEGKWLSAGEIFENWKVDSIEPNEIVMRQETGLLKVGIDYNGAPAQFTAEAPPPPPEGPQPEGPGAAPAKIVDPDSFGAGRDARRGKH
jgi:hypothetical protein